MAVVSYFGFHVAAGKPLPTPANTLEIAATMPVLIWRVAASIFQYLLPPAFLIGALVSAVKRKKRVTLLKVSTDLEMVREMPWREFEMLVGEAYRQQGYTVTENDGAGSDGGIDLVLKKDGQKIVVQCKRWKNFTVSVMPVRELYGVMNAENADSCIFVSSGTFTRDAISFAQGKPIELVDGQDLMRLLHQVQSPIHNLIPHPTVATKAGKACPKCSQPMVRRTAKRGANAGQEFWGCSDYPRCRGTA